MCKKRPSLPSDIALALRKDSGFGCCKCGCPIIQYHHIIPWEKEKHFRVEDMMCLCPNDHTEATEGAMSEGEQRSYKAHPYNINHGFAKGILKLNQKYIVINCGTNQFIGTGSIIKIDGVNILSLNIDKYYNLLINLSLFDEKGNKLLEIKNNEWISEQPFPWDIKWKFREIKIRNKKRNINLYINAKNNPVSIIGSFYYNQQIITFSPKRISVNGVVTNFSMENLAFVCMSIDIDTIKKSAKLVNNLPNSTIVSEMDINLRILKAINQYKKLTK